MAITTLPARVLVEPVMDNWIDDSDPEFDFRKGYAVSQRDQEGWHEVFFGRTIDVTSWLAEHGYEQVSCTMRRHKLAGRYEQTEKESEASHG